MDTSDYRIFILRHFERKQKINPRYSMRALSRDLGVSPSTLSEILNRHHTLSMKSSQKILARLKLEKKDETLFRHLVAEELFRKQSHSFVTGDSKISLKVDENESEELRKEIHEFFAGINTRYSKREGVEFPLYNEVINSLSLVFVPLE